MTIYSESQRKLINKIRHELNEATSSGVSSGKYVKPLSLGVRLFKDSELKPFTIPTTKYDDAELAYDSYDGEMSVDYETANKIEREALKTSLYNRIHPRLSDDDGDVLNNPIIDEAADTAVSSGEYNAPIEIGLRKWKNQELRPFSDHSTHEKNKKAKKKEMKNNVERVVGVWEKGSDGSYDMPTHDVHAVNEDLAVWFGKKKKPKGSKQPKGPWVNICRKVDGKHPPCGRPDADSKGYPKCRAAGVAGKMSDSEKRSACAQKRRAEKSDPKVGKGNKPTMTSYKPRNEEYLVSLIKKVLKEHLNGQ